MGKKPREQALALSVSLLLWAGRGVEKGRREERREKNGEIDREEKEKRERGREGGGGEREKREEREKKRSCLLYTSPSPRD